MRVVGKKTFKGFIVALGTACELLGERDRDLVGLLEDPARLSR